MCAREILEKITPSALDAAWQLEENGQLLEASSILRLLLIIHLDVYAAVEPPCVRMLLDCCRFLARHGEYDRIRQLRMLLVTAGSVESGSGESLFGILNTMSLSLPPPSALLEQAAA